MVTYQYDDNGNLLSRLDARSITTSFAYDALNRVVSRSYQNDPNSTPAVTYTYDSTSISNGTGRLASVTSSVSSYSYGGYDALGRISGATQTIGGQSYSLGYTYDLSGKVKTITYPSGRTVTNAYSSSRYLSVLLDEGANRCALRNYQREQYP